MEQRPLLMADPPDGLDVLHRPDLLVGMLDGDQDLLIRSFEHCRFANIPKILLGYREEKIVLSRILRGRYHHTISALEKLAGQHRYLMMIGVTSIQTLKILIDIVAVGTRLDHRLLRNRARPVSGVEREEWQDVWLAVTVRSPE